MNVLDARSCLSLHGLPGLGDISLARLLRHYGSPAKVLNSDTGQWTSLGVPMSALGAISAVRNSSAADSGKHSVETQLDALVASDADVIPLTDERYPALLQQLYDPPPILYVRGDSTLLQQAQLAIVGARKASPAGLKAATVLAGELVRSGLHITSGLALGIDQASHRGALLAGGKTVAVIATGIEACYPARHRQLAREIIENGCLVTEFPPGTAPLAHNFPKRNRILSGLSLGVLVVEAVLKSGSLITARTAMEQGREVFALPWSIFHPTGKGCLSLIRDGVKMVQSTEDILEEIGALFECQRELQGPESIRFEEGKDLSTAEKKVLVSIGAEICTMDELVLVSGLTTSTLLAALSRLEVARLIVRHEDGYSRA